ncbi:MAG: RNA polymerase sigma factor [Planctomycetota bacterium]
MQLYLIDPNSRLGFVSKLVAEVVKTFVALQKPKLLTSSATQNRLLRQSLVAELYPTFRLWLDSFAMFAVQAGEARQVFEDVDLALIKAARGGDEGAFRQIVESYQATIGAQMRRFSRDRNVIDSLVHDVFVEAFMSLGSYKAKSPFEHWLRKLAVRVGYRHWQAEARDKHRLEKLREEAATLPLVTEAPFDANEAYEHLHVMLAQLAPRDRLVLTLLYWDGLSVAEAAKLSGWTQALVKVQAHRARKRLKKLLEEAQ